MALESKYNFDKRCIFRSCFNDEATVRSQGGIPSNVTFQNGILSRISDNSYVTIPRFFNGTYTIRLIVKDFVPNGNWRYFYDFRSVSGGGAYGLDNNGVLTLGAGGGTAYINGVASTTLTTNTKEIVVSGFSVSSAKKLTILNSFNLASSIISSIELCEIYSGTLTAQEAKALYNNSRYKTPVLDHEEHLGGEIVEQNTWYTQAYWAQTWSANWSQTGQTLTSNGTSGALRKLNVLIVGKRYKITVNLNRTSGTVTISDNYTASVTFAGSGIQSDYFVATSTTLNMTSTLYSGSVESFSIKEVLVNRTKTILDVCACGGTIKNKLSGSIYGNNLVGNAGFDSDWVDSNSDGKPDGWNVHYGGEIVSIVSGNGFQERALRMVASVGSTSQAVKYGTTDIIKANGIYRVCMLYRTNSVIKLYRSTAAALDTTTFTANTGAAIRKTCIITSSVAGNLFFYLTSKDDWFEIDDVEVKEIIPSVIPTSVSVVQDGDILTPSFNGTVGSKVDCGSYDLLVGDKTFIFWFKYNKKGFTAYPDRLFGNNQIEAYVYEAPMGYIGFTSNTSTRVRITNNSAIQKKIWYFISITRTSSGLVSGYVNGTLHVSNGNSGTPVAGSSSLIIGNAFVENDPVNGNINAFRIIDGLLTPDEIMNLFTAEKERYNI